MGVMKTKPQPPYEEAIAGLVERVTYQNAENGFCVIPVKARDHRDLVTVVGHAAVISALQGAHSHQWTRGGSSHARVGYRMTGIPSRAASF